MKFSWKIFLATLFSATMLFAACDSNSNGDADNEDTAATTKNEAENTNDSALATKAAEKDAEFVVDVIASNYGEVKLAKLVQKRSTNPEIKDVAKVLESDHEAVLSNLKNLASKKGLVVPSEESGDAKDKLQELTNQKASEFDKEWCETLMDNHRSSISKFEKAANDISDPELRNFVNTTLPKLRTHHDTLMECHKKLK